VKVVVTKNDVRRYYTMADMARALGMRLDALWHRVYRRGEITAPGFLIGHRRYYTEADFRDLTKKEEQPVI
jgi:hypothetical protein